MSATLTIRDETLGGHDVQQWTLELPGERITVRELIRSRVYQEVQDYNLRQPQLFQGLVQPSEAERTLNGFKLPRGRQIDWKEQFDKALKAFQTQQVLVLVGDRQAESLEEEIEINPRTEVTFLRLVLLVGG